MTLILVRGGRELLAIQARAQPGDRTLDHRADAVDHGPALGDQLVEGDPGRVRPAPGRALGALGVDRLAFDIVRGVARCRLDLAASDELASCWSLVTGGDAVAFAWLHHDAGGSRASWPDEQHSACHERSVARRVSAGPRGERSGPTSGRAQHGAVRRRPV